ncbi:proteinase-activated receptor 3 [Oryzias latipes]|uniref:Coagulation factor II thrombin receptor like 2 n=1 Tax=Oryzias latipes TaxID=8090 RepID=A0A3B3HLP3_ORYLA|nr:proteinase-activated receptor 3 [Oryzias latipes]
MADLVQGLLICLMAVHTTQQDGKRTRNQTGTEPGFQPKTFKGSIRTSNHTKHPNSTDLWIYVESDSQFTAYTSGVLSTWVIPSSYILAMLVGIPSNAYILAFLKVKLRTKSWSTVVLYLNLAFCDLLLLLSLALRIHYHFSGNNWIFGEVSCRFVTALFYGNVYCSAQTIACLSLKRYLAVVKPFLYRRICKSSMAILTCLAVWFLFGAAIVPELLIRQSYVVARMGITTCHDILPLEEESHSSLIAYRLMLICLGFLLPFMVCVYSHMAVVYHLGQSSCDWKPFIRVSTLVFFIFVMCFSPSGILHMAHYIRLLSGEDDRLYGYYKLAVCLCCFHSCLDPFLCMLFSKTAGAELQFISFRGIPKSRAVKT